MFQIPTGVGSKESAGVQMTLEDDALKGTRTMGWNLENNMGHQRRERF